MKKQFLLAFGLATMMLAGCSDSDNVADGGNTPDPNATGYLSVRVALPSTSGYAGRAESNFTNDQNEQGVVDEYKVNSINLICFNDEDKVIYNFPITDGLASSLPPSTATGITTEVTLPVKEVSKAVKKVLVLVNKPTSLSIADGDKWSSIYGKQLTDNPDLTGVSNDNFFMTNTTLSNGSGLTTLLVNVEPKETQSQAMASPYTVNVERAVGKVSLSHNTGTGSGWDDNYNSWKYTVSETGYSPDVVEFESWVLDNTNKSTYAIRHYDKDWESLTGDDALGNNYTQRFFGSFTYKGNTPNEARTYWAQDLNYDIAYDAANFNSNASAINKNMGVPLYCLENTFDVDHMTSQQSTRVLLKAKYTPNNIATELAPAADKTWYRIGSNIKAYTESGINSLILEALTKEGHNYTTVTIDPDKLQAGENTLQETMFTGFDSDTDKKDKQFACIKRALGKITCFEDGYCYYEVRVQHFGKSYTPWGEESNAPTIGSTKFYDYAGLGTDTEEKLHYLGRYGIVRNNWYQLELGKVSAPGSPTVPELSDKADDEQKYYIQATVKIMDWAVRKQSVDL